MARDYGRKMPARSSSTKTSAKIILILASFLVGYLTAAVFDFSSLTAFMKQHFLKEKPMIQAKAKKKETIKPKFEFYTLLSKDTNALVPVNKVQPTKEIAQAKPMVREAGTLPSEAKISSSNPTKPAEVVESKPLIVPKVDKKVGTYLVQVAAFNRRQDAEHLKASLVLTGYDVNLTPFLKNNITWFRVIIGPFSSQGEAEKAKLTIAHSHKMQGMVRRV